MNERKNIKRVLLKLSGESLAAGAGHGIDDERLHAYAQEIAQAAAQGYQIAIVIGGGNIFRGMSGAARGFDRTTGDHMGMLATVINALAVSAALEQCACRTIVYSAIRMEPFARLYNAKEAKERLAEGYVTLFSAGTGNPYFTTDTASALRGIEIGADYLLKGTRVDGIYTADPEKDPSATRFETITFDGVYQRNLRIMDLTSMTMCRENNLPIIVFDMDTPGNLLRLLSGEPLGTLVYL